MRGKERIVVVLAAAITIALSARALPYLQVAGDELLFTGNDTYYHIWRVERTLGSFPRVPRFDPYHGFPEGTWDFLPPAFTLALSTFALVLGGGSPDGATVRLAGLLFPPLAGCLAIILAFFLGRRLFGREAGVHAALVLAVMTAAVAGTLLGRPDHHCATQALSLAVLLAISYLEERRSAASLATGLLLGMTMLTWLGSLVFTGIVTAGLVMWAVVDRQSIKDPLLPGAAALILAALVVLPAFHTGRDVFTFRTVSLFQPTVMFLCSVGLLGLWTVRALALGHRTTEVAAVGAACIIGVVIAVTALPEGLATNLMGMAGFLEGEGEFGPEIPRESQSLFFPEDGPRIMRGVFLLGTALPVGIAGLVLLLRKRTDVGSFMLALWCSVLLLLSLQQRRLTNELAAPLAVVCGYMVTVARRWLRSQSGSPGHALVLLALVGPSVFFSLKMTVEVPSGDTIELYRWMAVSTPAGTIQDGLALPPDYGIMSDWGMGYRILYLARRPPLADNGGCRDEPGFCGLDDYLGFMYSRSEPEAVGILKRLRGRYAVTTDLKLTNERVQRQLSYLGRDLDELYEPTYQDGLLAGIHLTPAFLGLTALRLHSYDGAAVAGTEIPPMERFRLVYESPSTVIHLGSRDVKRFKVFELVAGALLTGTVRPGANVSAEVTVETVQGRRFTYRATANADTSGDFFLRVPYATMGAPYKTGAIGPYVVRAGDHEAEVHVPEKDILAGIPIRVRWQPDPSAHGPQGP